MPIIKGPVRFLKGEPLSEKLAAVIDFKAIAQKHGLKLKRGWKPLTRKEGPR